MRYEIMINPAKKRGRVVPDMYWICAKTVDDPMFNQLHREKYKIVRKIESGHWTEPFDKWGRWIVPTAVHEHFPHAVFTRDHLQQYHLIMSDADRAVFNMLVNYG